MNRLIQSLLIATLAFAPLAQGADLPPRIQAKLLGLLTGSAGSAGKLAIKDASLIGELGGVNVSPDPGAKVAWAASEAEVKSYKAAGKLVICGRQEWLGAGGSIAIVEEGGKPQIYLHMGNIAASGVTLSETVLKIGKRI